MILLIPQYLNMKYYMKYENKINAIWFESFQLRYFGTLKYIFLVSKYLIVNSKHKMAAFF